jgi:hypothetical protein
VLAELASKGSVDPSRGPWRADKTGATSAIAALNLCGAFLRAAGGGTMEPSVGKYLIDGSSSFNPTGFKLLGPGVYTRENVIYTDKSVVFLHSSSAACISPSGGGAHIDGIVFYDPLQPGTGATPDLTRPPLISATAPARLVDITFTNNVVVNCLDFFKVLPGSLAGDCRITDNRIYSVRFDFWFLEWIPEVMIVERNTFTAGIFQDAAVVNNSAMLRLYSQENGANVAIDMSGATYANPAGGFYNTVDGWTSASNLWFGKDWARIVNGGFDVSTSTGDKFDSCDRILNVTGTGFINRLLITGPMGYNTKNLTPTVRTRAFDFNTSGRVRVTVSGGGGMVCGGDWLVDTGTGLTTFSWEGHVGAFGTSGQQRSGVATVTIASPGVWTKAAHGYANNTPLRVTTTGALPTGLTASSIYYVVNRTDDTFQLSATVGGSAINTSGTQSGVHTVIYAETMYGARLANANGRYSFKTPFFDNFGGNTECVGVSVVEAEEVNINGVSFVGMLTPIVVEDTMLGVVNVVGCNDSTSVSWAAKSLSVGATAISNGVVIPRANNWSLTADVTDV